MALQVNELVGGKILEVLLTGKLHKEDYQHFVPQVERLIAQHGKIRILMEMRDFHGWDLAALWQDVKFDSANFKHIERIAMVGDKMWEHGMAIFCKPFTTAEVRYFDVKDRSAALQWVESGIASGGAIPQPVA